jgi:membrane protein implicated in regulation of membrane protease activity
LILAFDPQPDWFTDGNSLIAFFVGLLVAHTGVILLSFALLVWYLVALVRHATLNSELKVIWVLILFSFNSLAMPVYWYLYIWRRQSPRDTPPSGAPLT